MNRSVINNYILSIFYEDFLNLEIVTGANLDRLGDHLDGVCTLKRVKNVTEKLMGSTLPLFNDLVEQAAPLTVEKFIKQLEKVYRKDLFATLESHGNLPGKLLKKTTVSF